MLNPKGIGSFVVRLGTHRVHEFRHHSFGPFTSAGQCHGRVRPGVTLHLVVSLHSVVCAYAYDDTAAERSCGSLAGDACRE